MVKGESVTLPSLTGPSFLNLNLTNNFNYGETFKLLYKSDENDQKTFETNLTNWTRND